MSKPSDAFDYIAIRLNSLESGIPTTFDTYVKVGNKFVLYCRSGDTLDADRFDRLQKKNIDALYILRGDFLAYQMYLQKHVDAAYDAMKSKPMPERAIRVLNFNASLSQRLMAAMDNENAYSEAKYSAQQFVLFLENEAQALSVMITAPVLEKDISQHGVRVAALAVILARELNLIASKPLPLIVLGCFLHDVEFHHSPFDYKRPLSSMSKEDLVAYKRHPNEGAQRAQTLSHIDPLVKQIILQHEEHADGTGFPRGLTQDDMDPLMMAIGLANAFDRLVMFEEQSPRDALKRMLIEKMGAYPLNYLQTLQVLLKKHNIVT